MGRTDEWHSILDFIFFTAHSWTSFKKNMCMRACCYGIFYRARTRKEKNNILFVGKKFNRCIFVAFKVFFSYKRRNPIYMCRYYYYFVPSLSSFYNRSFRLDMLPVVLLLLLYVDDDDGAPGRVYPPRKESPLTTT